MYNMLIINTEAKSRNDMQYYETTSIRCDMRPAAMLRKEKLRASISEDSV